MAVLTSTPSRTTSIGGYLLDRLQDCGVNHIFGIPGDYVLQFDKMIEEHPIQFINTTRENTAGFMADAYGRVQGLGAACITYGVGINITNAVAQAYVESSPVVIISGAASTSEFSHAQRLHHLFSTPKLGGRDQTQLEIFKKITVAQTVLDKPETAAWEIDRVIGECLRLKKPVYIELPRDMVGVPINNEVRGQANFETTDEKALQEAMKEIELILKNCRRPVIWVGHEANRFGLADHIIRFAEKYHIPIATSLLGKSAISETHPLFIGLYQGRMSREEVSTYVECCDCVFMLGVMLNDVDTGMFTVHLENAQKIHIATDTFRINHHKFDGIIFSDFIRALSKLDLNIRFKDDYPACIDRGLPTFKAEEKKITTERLFRCLESRISSNHIIVSDFGDSLFGGSELVVEQNAFFSNAFFATLGFGVPAAISIQIANPEKRVICLVGDGAFQMTCMELSTASRFGSDPIIILLNNHGYATERPLLEGEYNDIGEWNYAALPKVLNGGIGLKATTEKEFEESLNQALGSRGVYTLIEVDLGKKDFSPALKRFCHLVQSKKH